MPGKNSEIPKFDNDASISRGPKDPNIDVLVHSYQKNGVYKKMFQKFKLN